MVHAVDWEQRLNETGHPAPAPTGGRTIATESSDGPPSRQPRGAGCTRVLAQPARAPLRSPIAAEFARQRGRDRHDPRGHRRGLA